MGADASSASQAAPAGLAAYDRWSGRWRLLHNPPSQPALVGPPVFVFAEQQLLVLRLDGELLALGKRS